jgi:carbonic anhydrase
MGWLDDIKEKTIEKTSELAEDNPFAFSHAPEFVKKAVVDYDKERADTVAQQIANLQTQREQEKKDFAAKVATLKIKIAKGAKNIFSSTDRNDYKEYF